MNRFKSGFNGFTGWPDDIEAFLMFLKLFVARKRKSIPTGSILPFSLAIEKFVNHSEVFLFIHTHTLSFSISLPVSLIQKIQPITLVWFE